MGPVFVVFGWMIVATILCVIGGLILAGLVSIILRGVESGRIRAILIAGFLPAAAFAYLFGCLLVFSIWSSARGRDWGWGDTWDTPILGDYHLMMIDVTEQGTVYNRTDSRAYREGSVSSAPGDRGVIFGVRRLEVRPPYLIGAASPEAFMEYPVKSPETLFFILDTRSGQRKDEPSLTELETAAQQLGKPLKLQSVNSVYGAYRYGWIDLIPLVAFAIPPFAALIWLVRELLKLRAKRPRLASSS